MRDVRSTFLDAAAVTVELLALDDVVERWHLPSALEGLDVGALAAHHARAVLTVETALDGPEPPAEGPLVDAVGYYLAVEGLPDRGSPINLAVQARAAKAAADGHAAVLEQATASLDRLCARLGGEAPDRRVVALERPMLLDEYLRTRLVELAVHADDLAVSLDLGEQALPRAAADVAIEVLTGVAVGRIGTAAALRALARRERASRALIAF